MWMRPAVEPDSVEVDVVSEDDQGASGLGLEGGEIVGLQRPFDGS
jgi:hypothetical protein